MVYYNDGKIINHIRGYFNEFVDTLEKFDINEPRTLKEIAKQLVDPKKKKIRNLLAPQEEIKVYKSF